MPSTTTIPFARLVLYQLMNVAFNHRIHPFNVGISSHSTTYLQNFKEAESFKQFDSHLCCWIALNKRQESEK